MPYNKTSNKMKSITSQMQFQITGRVVQTFQTAGEKIAKIYIEPVSIDLQVESNEEVNLGDTITLEVSLTSKTIKPVNNNSLPF